MTYTHAIPTPGGWLGIVTSDERGEHHLFESATVCPDEEQAEVAAMREFNDACDAPRFDGAPAVLHYLGLAQVELARAYPNSRSSPELARALDAVAVAQAATERALQTMQVISFRGAKRWAVATT